VKILVAEDDREMAEFIGRGLRELGHNAHIEGVGTDALRLLSTEHFDVAIIDRLMPGLDGISIVRRLRAANIQIPVLLLTALGQIEDRVEGLDAGADDYLTKPFAFSELAARIGALSRRPPAQSAPTRLEHGEIVMDLLRRDVKRGGATIHLQPREFRLLEELMRNGHRVVTRTMLLERVWEFHFDPQTNIVETHISRLRSKLNEGERSDPIETVRGVGYRMRDAS